DAATSEHGDLLDLIARNRGLERLRDVLDEARAFLSLPRPVPEPGALARHDPAPHGSAEAARRLFAMAKLVTGTLAQSYLRRRGIMVLPGREVLRFHPRCYYRLDGHAQTDIWPAMIAAVTDSSGRLTGVQRTWLARDGSAKASIATPRRAMGDLLGHGVRFGASGAVMAAGEGIETMLSLRMVLPTMPMIAALSAGHLAAFLFPLRLVRLYIARDNDPAGEMARQRLGERADAAGIEAFTLSPALGDFNDDLCALGPTRLLTALQSQLAPEDAARFVNPRFGGKATL
ncbi:MAG TPA: toprim domain-containing protein, partial [Rhodocyclaceae bacterium]|nr:toprim domain-containing protein [Rhodocyclaceae bacterium]